MIGGLGYERVDDTGGSSRTYHNRHTNHVIYLHKPHTAEMKAAMVKRLRKDLIDGGAI